MTMTAPAATKSKTAIATSAVEPKEIKPTVPFLKKPSLSAMSRPSEVSLANRKGIAPLRATSSASNKTLADGAAVKGRASQSRQPSLRISSGATKMLSAGGSVSSRQNIRASVTAASSNGTKATAAEGTNSSSNNDRNNNDDNRNKASIFSPTRLFAPTASSLAKMRSSSIVTKSKTSTIIAQRAKTPPRNAVLDSIMNSPRGGGNPNAGSLPPSRDKIFT